MLNQISSNLYRYTELHGAQRDEPYDWSSYVVRIPDHNVVALIDPLEMPGELLLEIEKIGRPTHVLLTCEWHLRWGAECRERWGSQIWANHVESDRYEIQLDGTYSDGDLLWDTIECRLLPEGFYPETGLLIHSDPAILIIGDIISGGRLDQAIPTEQIGIIAPEYAPDLPACRNSLRRLLEWDFDQICFGHGDPVSIDAKPKLRAYLDSDSVWAAHAETRRRRGPQSAG